MKQYRVKAKSSFESESDLEVQRTFEATLQLLNKRYEHGNNSLFHPAVEKIP